MLPVCKNVILTGFMGAGKSTVGRILARSCGFKFVDLDEKIVLAQGKPIKEIFAEEGEEAFRNYESEALQSIKDVTHTVIATGGGIIMRSENRDLLKKIGVVVYLRASFETLLERVSRSNQRPLADLSQGTERLKSLLESRKSLYEQADIIVDTDNAGSSSRVATYILEQIEQGDQD